MIRVRPTRRVLTVAAAALLLPLLFFWLSVASHASNVRTSMLVPSIAIAVGGWELTRQGGPKRKDLIVMILGFAGLSFIVIVGYLTSGTAYPPGQ